MTDSDRPPAPYHSVTPRLFVDDVAAVAAFLRVVFDAVRDVVPDRPAELRMVRDPFGNVLQIAHRLP